MYGTAKTILTYQGPPPHPAPAKYEDTCMLFCFRAAGIDSQSLTYEKPYCRIAPYLVGMVLGYLLLHAKDWRLPSKVI